MEAVQSPSQGFVDKPQVRTSRHGPDVLSVPTWSDSQVSSDNPEVRQPGRKFGVQFLELPCD